MKKFSTVSTSFRWRSTAILVAAMSLMAVAAVACSSSDDVDLTATQPAVSTQAPVATNTVVPTSTTAPQTEPESTPAPTEVPATEVPTTTPDPTSVPPTMAPTVAPTATPDPFVTLTLLATGQVDPNRYPTVSPGDGELLERLFPDAPPYAAHKVDDIRITTKSNQCVTCHEGGFASGGKVATGIPVSHYTDQFTMDVSNDLDPRRYICTTCHVPQVTDPLPYGE